jgi:2-oxoacid:acceptor oxidoreductase delta subunit (pyruvate/2-ketoisovalerate family)
MPKPIGPGGFIIETNAGWRTERPVVDRGKCVGCLQCYLVCPEGTIYKDADKVAVDYDFCKGCGICAVECNTGAIDMIFEEA